jgi:predicted CXXCH cytochrome family protein
MTYTFKVMQGYTPAETLTFAYTDTMSIRSLWSRPELAKLVKQVKGTDASSLLLHLHGWKDSVYSTQFDDPAADNRALYKVQINLIPGVNNLYFAPGGRKIEALNVTKRFQTDFVSIESRTWRFHNSDLEKNCVTCHDGLPSAMNADSMTADCSSCHKSFDDAAYKHAPVEMKQCNSCHAWSKEKKIMTASQAVPDGCYGCHDAKHVQIDSSAVPHPVASDCLGCHSPHATNTEHLLKNDVYDLCSSCHSEYTLNHPVGKHPVRFAKVASQNDKEISCVSCHQPHGSANKSLLAVGGGTMSICLSCHNK